MSSRKVVGVPELKDFQDVQVDDLLADVLSLLALQLHQLKVRAQKEDRLLPDDQLTRLESIGKQLMAIKKSKPEGIQIETVLELDLSPEQLERLKQLTKKDSA